MEDNCIFCEIVRGEIPSEKIWEDEDFMAIKDVNPLVEGHTIVLSKKHYPNLIDASSSVYEGFLRAAESVAKKLMKDFGCEGFNLHLNNGEIAGQMVPHLHMHVLPRKKGDGFKPCA
jgi:histidine triad (HIT) family protein